MDNKIKQAKEELGWTTRQADIDYEEALQRIRLHEDYIQVYTPGITLDPNGEKQRRCDEQEKARLKARKKWVDTILAAWEKFDKIVQAESKDPSSYPHFPKWR